MKIIDRLVCPEDYDCRECKYYEKKFFNHSLCNKLHQKTLCLKYKKRTIQKDSGYIGVYIICSDYQKSK